MATPKKGTGSGTSFELSSDNGATWTKFMSVTKVTPPEYTRNTVDLTDKGTWEPVGVPIWAEVKCTKTQLSDQDGAMAYVTAYQFYIRRRSGITGNMRIRWKERTFELLGPPIDWKNEKNGLTLMAREVTCLMMIAEITNQEALEYIQANQKKLDETVAAAVPEAVSIARRYAPRKTGLLRKGIIAMPGLEKRRFKGKAVGEVVMDRGLNGVFQKPGKKGHHYYYPASQEYGFKHRVRGGGIGRVEGKHFMHVASRVYERAFTAKVVNMVEDLFSELG